jgi:uncharacterized protein YifE (UPF0438 family)
VQKKPHKVYKVNIEFVEYQIKELAKFIRNNKDKEVSFVINNKHIKFNSVVGKKKFAAGFEHGCIFAIKENNLIIRTLSTRLDVTKKELDKTKTDLTSQKEKTYRAHDKIRTNDLVKKLRQEAWADYTAELNEDRKILKTRLDKVEPVIKLVKEANTEGQLQTAYKLAKKLKV